MKRALHLLDTLRFGGAESVALNYARLMSEWEVASVLCGHGESADFMQLASEYASVKTRFSLRAIRETDYIFIHTNRNLMKLFLLRPFFRKRGKKIIYIQHLPYWERKFRLLSWLINRLCTGFVRITPLTAGVVDKHIRIPVEFVPNFYLSRYPESEHASIRQALREEYAIAPDQKLVLFTGVLRPGKGLDDFLTLAARFAEDGRYVFVVAGDGEEAVRIEAYPYSNLIWAGWQSDVERWLLAADAYCFCSRREMMPMALIEALAMGLPVAALSSEVNDFLLEGQTFDGVGAMEDALSTGALPTVPYRFGREYAAKTLKDFLRRKILHIQVLPKLTGVQRVSLEIFHSLPDEEYDKTILFGGPVNEHTAYCFARFREVQSKVLCNPFLKREIGWHDAQAFREIYCLCRRERFDIVHTHSTKPGIVGRIAARLAGVPWVVHTVHGVAFHRYVPLFKRLFYYLAEYFASFFSHGITLVSHYYKRYFCRKITVIPNGISIPEELPGLPEQSGDGTIHLLFVGRLEEPKDPLTLLRAFAWIVNQEGRKNYRLTLLGDGSLEGDCRDFITEHGLSYFVTIAGWVPEPTRFYTEHQIFCLSSIHEAFGLCLLEAGLHGLPVVATRVGGVPEVVRNGETGLLVPPRDPQGMAAAILRLGNDPDWRKRMGSAARKHVMECFTVEKMASAYQKIYNIKV